MKTKLLIVIFLLGCLCSEIASAQAPDTLFISTSQTVHIRFASELKYVNLGDRVILAKIVDGSKDFVAVKAREAFDYCTTMSSLEATGASHTANTPPAWTWTRAFPKGRMPFLFHSHLLPTALRRPLSPLKNSPR